MNRTRLIALSAALVAACGITGLAQAETYEGPSTFSSVRSRDEVNAEAVRAASAADQNVVRGSRGAERFTPGADAAAVRAGAIAAAHAPDQNVTGGSKVNSRVISTMNNAYEPAVAARPAAPSAK